MHAGRPTRLTRLKRQAPYYGTALAVHKIDWFALVSRICQLNESYAVRDSAAINNPLFGLPILGVVQRRQGLRATVAVTNRKGPPQKAR